MGRSATVFIVFCMGVIALSAAAVLVFQFGRPVGEALSLSLASMCTMIMVHILFMRSRDRGEVSEAVDRLEDRMSYLDEDVGNLEGRLTGVEHTIPRRTREEIDPLFAEVEVLGTLVKQMAEAMTDMETRIEDQRALGAPPVAPELPGYQTPPAMPAPGQAAYVPAGQHPGAAAAAQPAAYGHPPAAYPGAAQPYPAVHTAPEPVAPAQPGPVDQGFVPQPAPATSPAQPAVQAPATPASAPVAPEVRPPVPDAFADEAEPFAPPAPPEPEPSDPAMRELILAALNSNRVELHLQPIVVLPQRRVRYYEALTRIRDSHGELLEAAAFMPEAVRSGLVARIDNLLLFRSIQVIRRLLARNRDAAIFCNVSSLSLVDDTFFPGFLEFVQNNRNFAEILVFEFSQEDVAAMGAVELECLTALSDIGFRFSIDRITDMKMDFKAWAARGFKFAKLNADYLTGRREVEHGHIHPSDFGDLLHRYGMELIVDHIETEAQVLEVLDFDVELAQGFLFSPPRPVRAEILQGAPAPVPRARAAS